MFEWGYLYYVEKKRRLNDFILTNDETLFVYENRLDSDKFTWRTIMRNVVLIVLSAVIFSSIPQSAIAGIKWKLKVTYPDSEVKLFEPSKNEFNVKLHNSLWTCTLSKEGDLTANKNKTRALDCIKGLDVISIGAVCGKSGKFDDQTLGLGEIGKGSHRFDLSCDSN